MKSDVPVLSSSAEFPEIPSTVKLALVIPTARWNQMSRSVLGSMVGVADEEVAVLIADNSEDAEKISFLKRIRGINPHVMAVTHTKNIGAFRNFLYLYRWSRNVPFIAQTADDDWVSPTYHVDAYRALLINPRATCAEVGTTMVDIGDGNLVNVSQQSMSGGTAIERMMRWNGIVARVTMYNTSRRSALDAAIQFLAASPLNGITLVEDLWELNRLALGDFLRLAGHGCLLHYPATGSRIGDSNQRAYELYFKEAGMQYPFVFFGGLSTAVQCAMFLMGALSPITDPDQRVVCGQHVFRHIFMHAFLPVVSGKESQVAATMLFSQHADAMKGFLKYCNPPFSQSPVIDWPLIVWFVEVIRALEIKPEGDALPVSERFSKFANSLLTHEPAKPDSLASKT